ncbi:mechanosensitive ion channel [Terasakiella sp. A23]|uniref:mechanosensitive ion channel family protein n=1 Tax=Terasakiella sp. FCG-A23 TaxID=3080561 RepID=UPI002955A4A3|nr:mechanosensitive ion channel domain-containing protein [Terasakiella sp. A23]MDV7341367.1 mechanosensitive ion channel [Terasakiella sp. A23]
MFQELLKDFAYRDEALTLINFLHVWVLEHVFVVDNLKQVLILIAVFLVGRLLKRKLIRLVSWIHLPDQVKRFERPLKHTLAPLIFPIFLAITLWFTLFAMRTLDQSHQIIKLVVSLLIAWIVIRFASSLIKDRGWSKLVSVSAWSIAALNIVGLLDVTKSFLDSMAFSFGEMHFSLLGVVKGIIAVGILFWLFSLLEGVAKRRVDGLDNLTPSAKVLLKKFLRFGLIVLGVLIALDAMGIDLTALAVFSGAIGIGLGFGLQKVAANLVSGVILLMDRSVKPGDVISLGQTYGRIDKLGGRYVSVITRDGTETLIPNEELITQRVENWSFSDTNVRQRAMVGIDYSADVKLAMKLCVEAASELPRIVTNPAPRCLLREFGDSSVNIELRFWVDDPQNGLGNIRSEVLLKIWDKFHENGVAFPYPQRDIHVKGEVPVRILQEDAE